MNEFSDKGLPKPDYSGRLFRKEQLQKQKDLLLAFVRKNLVHDSDSRSIIKIPQVLKQLKYRDLKDKLFLCINDIASQYSEFDDQDDTDLLSMNLDELEDKLLSIISKIIGLADSEFLKSFHSLLTQGLDLTQEMMEFNESYFWQVNGDLEDLFRDFKEMRDRITTDDLALIDKGVSVYKSKIYENSIAYQSDEWQNFVRDNSELIQRIDAQLTIIDSLRPFENLLRDDAIFYKDDVFWISVVNSISDEYLWIHRVVKDIISKNSSLDTSHAYLRYIRAIFDILYFAPFSQLMDEAAFEMRKSGVLFRMHHFK